jgi:diguanylate cyclase (GGDEF)-like protein
VTLRTKARSPHQTFDEHIDREILLIEDQRSLALMAAKMLHDRWGCRVLIATTLGQVSTIIAQGQHDFFLAVSDLNLPDAPNGEVIDVLIAAKIPVIAVTGAFDRSRLDAFIGKGVIDYVLKNSINAYDYIVELVGRLHRNTCVKTMIVEDTNDYRRLIRHMLEKQGLQVFEASNGIEALAVLKQHDDIKLALVDYHMPEMDGFNLLAAIRRQKAKDSLSVIGMSSSEEESISAQFLKLGGNDFLTKPFTYEELVCRVSHNLQMLESIEKIRHIANHDYLTGLLNRRAFFEQGKKLHDAATAQGEPLCVAMLDIDFFKKINDAYGHDGGDAVLRHFAALLGKCFDRHIIGRLGGEEFAVIFPDTRSAIESFEAFRQQVEKSPVRFGEIQISLTVSIGLTQQLQSSLDGTLSLADGNLYKAKATGRNRIVSS